MDKTKTKLSALVVVHNEEDQLADCLSKLSFADEIVVVLDRCTDRSKKIAQDFQVYIVEGSWPLEGERRNTGIENCTGQWILEVDADERVLPPLAEEIGRIIEDSPYAIHAIPVVNYVGNRPILYGWGASFGVSSVPRLFRKGHKKWGSQRVHPALEIKGQQGPPLENPLHHYVDQDISDMIRRFDRYTTARALDLRDSDNIGTFRANLRRLFHRFWKCFVSRKGYREKEYGFLIALMAGLYPIISYLKARLDNQS